MLLGNCLWSTLEPATIRFKGVRSDSGWYYIRSVLRPGRKVIYLGGPDYLTAVRRAQARCVRTIQTCIPMNNKLKHTDPSGATSLIVVCSLIPACSAAIFCSANAGACSGGVVCSGNAGACSGAVACSGNIGVCSGGIACSGNAGPACSAAVFCSGQLGLGTSVCSASALGCSGQAGVGAVGACSANITGVCSGQAGAAIVGGCSAQMAGACSGQVGAGGTVCSGQVAGWCSGQVTIGIGASACSGQLGGFCSGQPTVGVGASACSGQIGGTCSGQPTWAGPGGPNACSGQMGGSCGHQSQLPSDRNTTAVAQTGGNCPQHGSISVTRLLPPTLSCHCGVECGMNSWVTSAGFLLGLKDFRSGEVVSRHRMVDAAGSRSPKATRLPSGCIQRRCLTKCFINIVTPWSTPESSGRSAFCRPRLWAGSLSTLLSVLGG
jgi:hypothetical protein